MGPSEHKKVMRQPTGGAFRAGSVITVPEDVHRGPQLFDAPLQVDGARRLGKRREEEIALLGVELDARHKVGARDERRARVVLAQREDPLELRRRRAAVQLVIERVEPTRQQSAAGAASAGTHEHGQRLNSSGAVLRQSIKAGT